MDIFSYLFPKYTIDRTKPLRLISLFSGYDSQKLGFDYLNIPVEHYRAIEFDKYAIQSLNEIHETNFTTNDITKINADDLGIIDTENYTYLLTYSFPCTDLSNAGKKAGMEKGSGTRSGLLWEVERLLKESKEKCQVLIMENVPQVLSSKGWREWVLFLESLGYSNYVEVLNAKDYGIPQNRERCFMVSILGNYSYEFPKKIPLTIRLKDILEDEVDEKYYLSDAMKRYVCSRMPMGENKINIGININNKNEPNGVAGTICTSGGNQPNDNFIILNDDVEYSKQLGWFKIIDSYNKYIPKDQMCVGTIPAGYGKNQGSMIMEKKGTPTLIGGLGEKKSNGGTQYYQQDRIYDGNGIAMCHPANLPSGSYMYCLDNIKIRKLTPCECFKLMGVNPTDYAKLTCSNAQKYKQAGNSIVTTVLMAIYSQLFDDVDYKYYIDKLVEDIRSK